MLARITYGVVAVAFATLIAGFFQRSSNALLYVSIVLSVLAIVLVLIGAARRAREVPVAEPAGPSMAEEPASRTMEEPDAAGVLSSLDLDEDDDEDELEEVAAPRARSTPTRRAPASRSRTRAASRPAASRGTSRSTTSRSTTARSTAASRSSRSPAKVLVVPGRDRYHATGCRFIVDKADVEEISSATAKRRGYQRCSVCKPD